jgi:hypothetical protein
MQAKIAEIHEAASTEDLQKLEKYISKPTETRLLFARDSPTGCTPLHKAVLMESKLVIDALVSAKSKLLHCKDAVSH